jgi:hypothetical protein
MWRMALLEISECLPNVFQYLDHKILVVNKKESSKTNIHLRFFPFREFSAKKEDQRDQVKKNSPRISSDLQENIYEEARDFNGQNEIAGDLWSSIVCYFSVETKSQVEFFALERTSIKEKNRVRPPEWRVNRHLSVDEIQICDAHECRRNFENIR